MNGNDEYTYQTPEEVLNNLIDSTQNNYQSNQSYEPMPSKNEQLHVCIQQAGPAGLDDDYAQQVRTCFFEFN